MNKANAQKNTLLKNAQANAESIFFKRVFLSPTQKRISKYFSNASKKIKNANTQPTLNDTTTQYRQWFTNTVDKNASW